MRHLIRALGRYRLADLTPAIVEPYLEEAKAKGLSVGTRRRHLTLLRKAPEYAVEKGALHRNPARQVRLRYRNGSVREVLTESELKALWQAAEGSYYRDPFRLPLSPRHLLLAIKKLALRAGMDPDVVAKKAGVHALVKGELVEIAPAGGEHGEIAGRIAALLGSFVLR